MEEFHFRRFFREEDLRSALSNYEFERWKSVCRETEEDCIAIFYECEICGKDMGKEEVGESVCNYCFQRCLYCGMFYPRREGGVIRGMECMFCRKVNQKLRAIAFAKRCYALAASRSEGEEPAVSPPSESSSIPILIVRREEPEEEEVEEHT